MDVTDFSADLTFGYNESQLQLLGISEDDLTVSFFDSLDSRGDIWHSLPVTIDIGNKTIIGNTSHFSLWAIIEKSEQLITSVEEAKNPATIPEGYKLSQNYPNPFNPETKISYTIPKSGVVVVNVYDLTGKLVKNLVNQQQTSGTFTVKWDGTNSLGKKVSTGIYFFQLKSGNANIVRRMLLIK